MDEVHGASASTPGVHKYLKNLGTTSNSYTPEG